MLAEESPAHAQRPLRLALVLPGSRGLQGASSKLKHASAGLQRRTRDAIACIFAASASPLVAQWCHCSVLISSTNTRRPSSRFSLSFPVARWPYRPWTLVAFWSACCVASRLCSLQVHRHCTLHLPPPLTFVCQCTLLSPFRLLHRRRSFPSSRLHLLPPCRLPTLPVPYNRSLREPSRPPLPKTPSKKSYIHRPCSIVESVPNPLLKRKPTFHLYLRQYPPLDRLDDFRSSSMSSFLI